MIKLIKKFSITLILLSVFIITVIPNVFASTLNSNGTYEVSYEVTGTSSMGKTMISKNFPNKFKLEKLNDNYYLSINYDTSSSMSDLKLSINDLNVGTIIRNKNNQMIYTYTLSENSINNELPFSVYVSAMQRRTEFNIKLDLSNSNKISDDIEDLGERPGEFIPELKLDLADEYSIKAGNNIYFNVIEAEASLGDNECVVTKKAYYNDNPIDINDNKILIEKTGIYKLVYKAESDKYKTSLGNNTYIEKTIIINASNDKTNVVKLVNTNDNYYLIGGIIENGNTFDNVSKLMDNISINYSIFDISFYSNEGIKLDKVENELVDVYANLTIDRTKTKAYYIDSNNNLKEVDSKGAGRYVRLNISESGTYIVCEPGVPFVMPMWGYIIIICGSLVLVGSISAFIIIKLVKKKRKNKLETE